MNCLRAVRVRSGAEPGLLRATRSTLTETETRQLLAWLDWMIAGIESGGTFERLEADTHPDVPYGIPLATILRAVRHNYELKRDEEQAP